MLLVMIFIVSLVPVGVFAEDDVTKTATLVTADGEGEATGEGEEWTYEQFENNPTPTNLEKLTEADQLKYINENLESAIQSGIADKFYEDPLNVAKDMELAEKYFSSSGSGSPLLKNPEAGQEFLSTKLGIPFVINADVSNLIYSADGTTLLMGSKSLDIATIQGNPDILGVTAEGNEFKITLKKENGEETIVNLGGGWRIFFIFR